MLTRIMLTLMLATLMASPTIAGPLMDAAKERAAAIEAEKNGDYAAALLHYENIYDSCITDDAVRMELRTKFAELRPKVEPNTDPDKAGVWKIRAYVFRTLDFSWKDKEGSDHHAFYKFRDDEIEAIKVAMDAFADCVWTHSMGSLRIVYDLKVIEKPLTKLEGEYSFWPGPSVCMPYFDDLKPDEVDGLFVYAKIRGDKSEESGNVPPMLLAGTLGVLPNTKGATYIGFNSGGGWCMEPSGEVQWHEWLHSAQWVQEAVQAYPPGLMASADDGRYEGQSGGDPCFRRTKDQENWMPYYVHIMEQHGTRKMWKELSATKKPESPWLDLYCREFSVCGPFDITGKQDQGLDIAFIDEENPLTSCDWKKVSVWGRNLDFSVVLGPKDYHLAYAALVVRSDEDKLAQVRLGTDDGCKLWHNGRLILCAPVLRPALVDQNIVDVQLKKGDNLFLLKVANGQGGWEAIFRITDQHGDPLDGVEYDVPK